MLPHGEGPADGLTSRELALAQRHMLTQVVQAAPRRGDAYRLMCHGLAASGYAEVAVAELVPNDLPENQAALAIAIALMASGLGVGSR